MFHAACVIVALWQWRRSQAGLDLPPYDKYTFLLEN